MARRTGNKEIRTSILGISDRRRGSWVHLTDTSQWVHILCGIGESRARVQPRVVRPFGPNRPVTWLSSSPERGTLHFYCFLRSPQFGCDLFVYETHFNLCIAYERAGRLNAALSEITAALNLNLTDREVQNMHAETEQGDLGVARQEWSNLIRAVPDYLPVRCNLITLDAMSIGILGKSVR